MSEIIYATTKVVSVEIPDYSNAVKEVSCKVDEMERNRKISKRNCEIMADGISDLILGYVSNLIEQFKTGHDWKAILECLGDNRVIRYSDYYKEINIGLWYYDDTHCSCCASYIRVKDDGNVRWNNDGSVDEYELERICNHWGDMKKSINDTIDCAIRRYEAKYANNLNKTLNRQKAFESFTL